MLNPELEFRDRFKPDYTGMTLTELDFCEMEDYDGVRRTYRLDLITRPDKVHSPRPVVLFIHGGGFTQPCDKRQAYISVFARRLTDAGYAVVSPDYPVFDDETRFNGAGGEKAGYFKAGEAVHRAYQYIVEHAGELELDSERIAIAGGSAGGMAAFYGIGNYSDCYRAFVNLWGAPEQIPDMSGFPPTLSVHGTADAVVPFQREMLIQEKLETYNIEHQLISLDGSGHTPLDRMDDFLPSVMKLLDRTLT